MSGLNAVDSNRETLMRQKALRGDLERQLEKLSRLQVFVAEDLCRLAKGEPLKDAQLYGIPRDFTVSDQLDILALRMRLKSYQNEVEKEKSEIEARIKQGNGLGESLLKCPTCRGTGQVNTSMVERDDGQPRVIVDSKTCPTCKGAGTVEAGINIL